MQDITYPRASTVAQSLTIDRNFARISSSQESARINASIMSLPWQNTHGDYCSPPSHPQAGASGRPAIAKLRKYCDNLAVNHKEFSIHCN